MAAAGGGDKDRRDLALSRHDVSCREKLSPLGTTPIHDIHNGIMGG